VQYYTIATAYPLGMGNEVETSSTNLALHFHGNRQLPTKLVDGGITIISMTNE